MSISKASLSIVERSFFPVTMDSAACNETKYKIGFIGKDFKQIFRFENMNFNKRKKNVLFFFFVKEYRKMTFEKILA